MSFNIFNRIVDTFFCIDLVVMFRASYFNDDGEEIIDGMKIARSYVLSGRFFIDFLASVPIDIIVS
jgi:hypothetical protein